MAIAKSISEGAYKPMISHTSMVHTFIFDKSTDAVLLQNGAIQSAYHWASQ